MSETNIQKRNVVAETSLQSVHITEVWPKISTEISKLIQRYNYPFSVCSVLRECLAGMSLVLANEDGFMIVDTRRNEETKEREMHIWICCSYGSNQDGSIFHKYKQDVAQFAQSYGCNVIVFRSKRLGFQRAFDELNIREIEYEWRLDRE